MTRVVVISAILAVGAVTLRSQTEDSPAPEKRHEARYAIAVIDDATSYSGLPQRLPAMLNRVLVEPSLGVKFEDRLTLSTSLIQVSATHDDTATMDRLFGPLASRCELSAWWSVRVARASASHG